MLTISLVLPSPQYIRWVEVFDESLLIILVAPIGLFPERGN